MNTTVNRVDTKEFLNTWTVSDKGIAPPKTLLDQLEREAKEQKLPLKQFDTRIVKEFLNDIMKTEGFTYNVVNLEKRTVVTVKTATSGMIDSHDGNKRTLSHHYEWYLGMVEAAMQ